MIIFYILMVFPITAVVSFLVYLPAYFYNKSKYGKRPVIRHLAIYGFIGVILSIIYVTLFIGGTINFHPPYHFLNLIPFIWVKETYAMGFAKMIEQLFMNAVMLIPLGFILPVVFTSVRKWWKTALCVMLFILGIETFQYFIGRSADIDDLIMNTLGGVMGYLIYFLMNILLNHKRWWQCALNVSKN
jgi:glycopeptide antibiotics resistance protein